MKKISVSDLSIGDWVAIEGRPKRISTVLETPMGGMVRCQKQSITVFVEHISPIPLTPEILEKNGVALAEDYDEYSALYTCPQFSVIKYGDSYTFEVPQARIHVEYAHELQHAIRLAGIEKEIEL